MTDPGAHATPPPPNPPRPSYSHRRLLRFPDDGPLGGVCAGAADYLSIDPTIVRIAAVILAITGPGIPAYILAWLIVPAADGTVVAPWPHDGEHRRDRFSGVLGVVLIFLALFFLVDHWWWEPARGWFVPVSLIAVGAWLLLRRHDEDDVPPPPLPPAPPAGPGSPSSPWQASPPTPATSVVPVPPLPPTGATEPTSPSERPADGTDTPEDHDVPDTDTTVIDEPTTTSFAPGDMGWAPPPPGGDDPTAVAAAPPPGGTHHHRPRRRRVLGPVVFGALLLWTGIAWLIGVSATTGLAVGLCLVGVGFIVGAFTGGSRGLIIPALLIGFALIVASTVDIPFTAGIGRHPDTVTSMRDLHRTYELAIGEQVLDLRNLHLPDRTTKVTVKVGIGHLQVIVPDDAALAVNAKAGAGSVDLFGHEDGGTSLDVHRELEGDRGEGKLDLKLSVGLGRIDLRRAGPTIDGVDGGDGSTTDEPATTTLPTPTTPTTPPTPTVAAA